MQVIDPTTEDEPLITSRYINRLLQVGFRTVEHWLIK
jgi:hypothetical protein